MADKTVTFTNRSNDPTAVALRFREAERATGLVGTCEYSPKTETEKPTLKVKVKGSEAKIAEFRKIFRVTE